MSVSHENVQQAFADALEHVKSATTPQDGGLTEAAVQVLRDMISTDANFQQAFNEKLQSVATAKQEAIAQANAQKQQSKQAPDVQPAKQGNTGSSQQGDHAAANAAPGTEGGASSGGQ